MKPASTEPAGDKGNGYGGQGYEWRIVVYYAFYIILY
jgi:hypothetical protein